MERLFEWVTRAVHRCAKGQRSADSSRALATVRPRRVLLLVMVALGLAVPAAWAATSQQRSRGRGSGAGSSLAANGTSAANPQDITPIPPLGLPIDTISGPDGKVRIGDNSYGTGALRLVVVNRDSPDTVHAFPFANDASGIAALRSKADEFNNHWLDVVTAPSGLDGSSDGAKAFNDKVVTAIGGAPLDEGMLKDKAPVSVVGVLGWDRGTAYENLGHMQETGGVPRSGALVGYLQRNPASQAVGFVFGDYPSFSTRSADGSATIDVAGVKYEFPIERNQGGFAVVVLNRANLGLITKFFFATRAPNVVTELGQQVAMGAFLKQNRDPSHLIIVQSISSPVLGSPRPTTTGWNDLAAGITDVGGTPDVINRLNTRGAYSLVTVPGVPGDAVESFTDKSTRQDEKPTAPDGEITGVLARDHSDGFAPLFADPTGQPTRNDLLQLSYGKPSTWPDRDTPGRRAAISYIAQQLELPVDDPRLDYTNLTINFGDDSGRLERMTYPGGSVPFSAEDFATVKSELLKEFTWVSRVRAYTDAIRQVMDESIVIKQGVLSGVAEGIKSKSGIGNPETKVNAFQTYAQLFTLAKIISPDPQTQAAAGAVATVFNIASAALTKGNGTNVLGTFTTTTNNLAHDLVTRYAEGLDSLGLMRSIIVSDHDKLETAGNSIIKDKPGWVWNDTISASTRRAMTLAAKRLINEALLPIPYVTYHLPGNFPDPTNCRVLQGEPKSAWITRIISFSGSPGDLHANTQAWAVGKRQGGDVYGGFIPNAELFNPLFKEVSPDSDDFLGLSKPVFITKVMGQADLAEKDCQPH